MNYKLETLTSISGLIQRKNKIITARNNILCLLMNSLDKFEFLIIF